MRAVNLKFRCLRIAAGMSQADLANAAGMNRSKISALENFALKPSKRDIYRLAKALNSTEVKLASFFLNQSDFEKLRSDLNALNQPY